MNSHTVKRLLALTAALLLGVGSLVCAPNPVYAADIIVDDPGDAGDANAGNGVCDTGSGVCTLRAAIEEANALAGADSISFNIGGGGIQIIALSSVLPGVTGPLVVDGSTQPGFAGVPLITVDADGVSGSIFAFVGHSGSALRNLRIANASGTALLLNDADAMSVVNVDVRWFGSKTRSGNGIYVSNGSADVSIQGVQSTMRDYGIYTNGASDLQVINSNLRDNNTALFLYSISSASLPGGLNIANNDYTDSGTGMYFESLSDLVISDGSVLGTNVDVTLDGITHTLTSVNGRAIRLRRVDDVLVSNIDLSWAGTGQLGSGIYADSSMDGFVVQDVTISDREIAIFVSGGSDVEIHDADLSDNGMALDLRGIAANLQPAPVQISGNDYTGSVDGVRLYNVANLVISDGSAPGTDVDLSNGSGNETLQSVSGTALWLQSCDNIRVESLDLSWYAGGRSGDGLYIDSNGNDTLYVTDLVVMHRDYGIYFNGGSDVQIYNSTFGDDGWGLWLNSITPNVLPEALRIAGNDYTGCTNGVRLGSMSGGMIVSDGSAPNTTIDLTNLSGMETLTSTVGTALQLSGVADVTVTSVNLSWDGDDERRGYGLYIDGSGNDRVTVQSINSTNRLMGLYASGGSDLSVLDNDLSNNGSSASNFALYIRNMSGGTLPGSVQVSGNDLSDCDYCLRLEGLSDLVVSDGTAGGTNVNLAGAALAEAAAYPLYLLDVDDTTITALDLSWGGSERSGYGVYSARGSDDVTIQDITATHRVCGVCADYNALRSAGMQVLDSVLSDNGTGINLYGGSDARVMDNDLSHCDQALYLNDIIASVSSDAVQVSGNDYSGSSNGVYLRSISGMVISDGSAPDTNVDLTDAGGMETLDLASGTALRLYSTADVTVTNLSFSWTGDSTRRGYGVYIEGINNNRVTIQNIASTNRRMGLYAGSGSDLHVLDNDFSNCGFDGNNFAMYLYGVTSGAVLVEGNTVNDCDYCVRLQDMSGLTISDGSVGGTNVDLSGVALTGASLYPLYLGGVDNTIIEALDFSWNGSGQSGYGIYAVRGVDNLIIQNVTAQYRNYGLYAVHGGGSDYTQDIQILDNTLTYNDLALYVNGVRAGTLPGGLNIAGNNYAGSTNGLRFENVSNLVFSDGSASGTNVDLTDMYGRHSLTKVPGYALRLYYNVDNVSVSNLDLSWHGGASRAGCGLCADSGDNDVLSVANVLVSNRNYGISLNDTDGAAITCSSFFNDNEGVYFTATSDSGSLHNNTFQGNSLGVHRDVGSATLDATNNYWGAADGPSNLGGSGDSYSGPVDADPFSTSAPACAATSGKFVVNTTNDTADGDTSSITALLYDSGADGVISLREAILATNNTPGSDTVAFEIGSGAQTIALSGVLPAVTDTLILDGSSQPGFVGIPLITLDAGGASGTILGLSADDTVIRELSITDAPGTALSVSGADGVVLENVDVSYTGTDSGTGLGISSSSDVMVIGLTAEDRVTGVDVTGSSDVTIACAALLNNTTGLDADNASSGVQIAQSHIQGNGTGVNNGAASALDATNNYWGSAGGPVAGDYNGNVTVSPYLSTSPNCISPSALVVTTRYDVSDGDTSSVTNLLATPGPDGAISLREAIVAANATAGSDTIGFAIGMGAQTVLVASALPNITGAIELDGASQPGFAGDILITIDAQELGGDFLYVNASDSTINDIAIVNAAGTALRFVGADNILIDHVDVSWATASRTGTGIYVENGDVVTVANSASRNRLAGITISGGSDASVTDNDVSNSGGSSSECALRLYNVSSGTLPGGVLAYGNTFTGAGYALCLRNLSNLVISDGSAPGTRVTLSSADGLDTATLVAMDLRSVVASTIDSVDASWSGSARKGQGLYLESCNGITITNSDIQNRYTGLYAVNGSDVRVTNNDFSYSGYDLDNPALYLNAVGASVLPGGVQISGNTFFNAHTAVRMSGMSNLNIAGSAGAGINLVFASGDGLNTTTNYPLYLRNVDDVTADGLDLSYTGVERSGYGFYIDQWSDNVVLRNLSATNRNTGVYVERAYDVQVYNNDLSDNDQALYLYEVLPVALPGGVLIYGNDYSDSADGVYLERMANLIVSDGSAPDTNVNLTDSGGAETLTSVANDPLYLVDVNTSTIQSLALYALTQRSGGRALYAENCDTLTVEDLDVRNRQFGMYFLVGSDIEVLNNDFSGSGWFAHEDYSALFMSNVLPGNLPGGVNIAGNTFADSHISAQFRGMQDLNIANSAGSGINVVFSDDDGLNAATRYPLYLRDVTASTVDGLDLSWNGWGGSGRGLNVNGSCRDLVFRNLTANYRETGIHVDGSIVDLQVYDNDLRNNTDWALYLSGVSGLTLPGGLSVYGNDYSASSNGVSLNAVADLIISDGSVPSTNVDLTNGSGVETLPTITGDYPLRLYGVDDSTLQNLDLSRGGAQSTGYGLYVLNSDRLSLRNLNVQGCEYGMYISGGVDVQILDSDFSGSGWYLNSSRPALYLEGVLPGSLAGGVNIAGNTFADSYTSVYFRNMRNLTIADTAAPGVNVVFATDSGLNTASDMPLYLRNVDTATIDGLDLSWYASGTSGTGLYAFGGCQNLLVRNTAATNRDIGIEVEVQAYDVQIYDNDLRNSGEWALSLDGVYEATLPGGVRIYGNDYGGSANGLSLADMSDLVISDCDPQASGISLGESGGGLTSVHGDALYLNGVSGADVSCLNLSYENSYVKSGYGLDVESSTGVVVANITAQNRIAGIYNYHSQPMSIACSSLSSNTSGLFAYPDEDGITITNSTIQGNSAGIRNQSSSYAVVAENDYWGAADGPSNLGGSGDSYRGLVVATPFLTAAPACISYRDVSIAPPAATAYGDPGTKVVHTPSVTNDGSCCDVYDVVLSGVQWYTVAPATFGPVCGGLSESLPVTVTVPASALCGASDTITVTLVSQTDPNVTDYTLLTTVANPVYGIEISPSSDEGVDVPGADVVYTLNAVNRGNCVDTFTGSVGGNAWSTVVPSSIGPLAANSGVLFDVAVTIPSPLAGAASDVALVSLTSQADGTKSDTTTLTTVVSNLAPVADDDAFTVDEDSTANVLDVLDGDTDANLDALTVSAVGTPSQGGVVFNAGTHVTYTPAPDFFGTETFTYTITDGNGGFDSAWVTVSVINVNDPPVAEDDVYATLYETTLTIAAPGLLDNDLDIDGDLLTATLETAPASGSASVIPDGGFIYTPTGGFEGFDTFTYRVTDGALDDTATVTVAVSNDVPSAAGDAYSTAEDTPLTVGAPGVLANDSDPNSLTITPTLVARPLHGVVVLSIDGAFVYTPTQNYNGSDRFTYRLFNGTYPSSPATVAISVTPVNDAPVALNDAFTVAEDSVSNTLGVLDNDSDVDGDTLSISAVGVPGQGGSLVNAGDSIAYTPAANFFGTETFTYTIADGNGGYDTANVSVVVTPKNDPPVADDDAFEVEEASVDNVLDVLDGDTDVDGDVLHISVVYIPSQGGTAINGGDVVTYTPAEGFVGNEVFTYTVSDGHGGYDTAVVAITVLGLNHDPVADNDTFVVSRDSADNALDVLDGDTDEDGDVLSISAVGAPSQGGTAVNGGDVVTYTTPAGFQGTETFTYTVSDGYGGYDTALVTVTIRNAPPVADNDFFTVPQDSANNSLDVLDGDTDADGDTLSISAVGVPNHGGTIVNGGDMLTYTPVAGFEGFEAFTYTVSDGHGGYDTASVSVSVLGPNVPPTISPIADQWTLIDTPISTTFTVSDTDDPVDSLIIRSDSSNTALVDSAGLTTDCLSGNCTLWITPTAGISGTSMITLTVDDGRDTADASFELAVTDGTPANHPPSFTSTPVTAAVPDAPYAYTVTADDPDAGDTLSISASTAPAWLALDDNGDGTALLYGTPTVEGDYAVVLEVSDGQAGDTQSFTITVGANQAPVANAGSDQTVYVNDSVTLNGSASQDPEGGALTYGWTQTSGPAVTLSSSTAVQPTFVAPDTAAVLVFSLAVTDTLGLPSAPDTVVITVEPRLVFLPLVMRNTP